MKIAAGDIHGFTEMTDQVAADKGAAALGAVQQADGIFDSGKSHDRTQGGGRPCRRCGP